jgi:hypothetical protein
MEAAHRDRIGHNVTRTSPASQIVCGGVGEGVRGMVSASAAATATAVVTRIIAG